MGPHASPDEILVARPVRESLSPGISAVVESWSCPGVAEEGGGYSRTERHMLLLRVLERAQEKLQADLLHVTETWPERWHYERRRTHFKASRNGLGESQYKCEDKDREENLRKHGSFQLRMRQLHKLEEVRVALGALKTRMACEAKMGLAPRQLSDLSVAPA